MREMTVMDPKTDRNRDDGGLGPWSTDRAASVGVWLCVPVYAYVYVYMYAYVYVYVYGLCVYAHVYVYVYV